MGRDPNEGSGRRSRKERGGQRPTLPAKGITSYKFTAEEVEAVAEEAFDIDAALAVLGIAVVSMGLKLTIGTPPDRPGVYCVIRDGAAKWGEGLAISCWAVSPMNALITAAWYLDRVNPDFPDMPEGMYQLELLF